jgi:Lrp/AsnC family transcriptional regulator for asnA, asnC and gidA
LLNLSLKDKKLLYELDINSRQSLQQIAKKIGVHKNVVRYKINRLEELEVIKNYYTVIDSYKLGYKVIKLYVIYQNINSKIKKEIEKYFINSKITWLVASIEGEFDLDVIFWIKNLNEFYSFWEKTLKNYGNYFKENILIFQIKAISYKPTFLLDIKQRSTEEKYEITGKGKIISIDNIDLNILRILSLNARIPIIKIANELNLTSNIVQYRIKKLKKMEIIQGFRTDIDISKLGYTAVKVDIFLNNYSAKYKIINYIKNNPYLICIMNSIGFSHIELEFNVKNMTDLYRIMEDLIDKFPNSISNYKYFNILECFKLCWLPYQ